MVVERVVLTYQDYAVLPADGRRYEIHEGELSVTPAPSPQHQTILGNLNEILREHVKTRGLGKVFFAPVDCILDATTIVQPDLIYLDATRLSLVSSRGVEGAPALVVEVLSPSTTLIDRNTKRQLYQRHRVPCYWIVDPEARTIEAYRLSDGAYQLVTRAAGSAAVSLPPFSDLALIPASLWS
jgi:Uma2 family endonuclease